MNERVTQTRVAWIGTGVMGVFMCRKLMAAGYPVAVFNRTRAKARLLLDEGAIWRDSAAAAAADADLVFTMVGFPGDVERVYLAEDGILAATRPGALLVDMTTTKPSLARRILRGALERGADFVDAPVSGGDVGARNGTLSIMAGGSKQAVDRVWPFFELMGKNIVHQGRAGAGQHAKMCNQIAIAGTMVGVSECLIYGYKAGLDLETMLSSIRSGAAGCWTLENLAPRVLRRDFNPGFYIDHFIKDMEIALEEAGRMDLCLPGLALANQLYHAVKACGKGKCGTQALILGLEQMAGLDPDQPRSSS